MSGGVRLLAVLAAALGVIGAVGLLAAATDHPIAFLTRDPAAAVQDGVCDADCAYAGLLSNLGVVVWCAGAVSCLIAAYVMRARAERPESARALAWGGVVLGVLLMDDLYQLHEIVLPSLLPGGERVYEAGYAFGGLLYVIVFRDFLMRFPWGLLPAGAALLVSSAALDHWWAGHHLVEDGAKFMGIVVLVTFFITMSLGEIRRTVAGACAR